MSPYCITCGTDLVNSERSLDNFNQCQKCANLFYDFIRPTLNHDLNQLMNPQSVTERYIHRLLTRGRNDIFELESVTQRVATHDNIPVGIFFEANVKRSLGFENQVAAGATPREAVRRSLEKHGVTFR